MDAMNVEKLSVGAFPLCYIRELILERNPISVQNVGKPLLKNQILLYIRERIQERKPMGKAILGSPSSLHIRELMVHLCSLKDIFVSLIKHLKSIF